MLGVINTAPNKPLQRFAASMCRGPVASYSELRKDCGQSVICSLRTSKQSRYLGWFGMLYVCLLGLLLGTPRTAVAQTAHYEITQLPPVARVAQQPVSEFGADSDFEAPQQSTENFGNPNDDTDPTITPAGPLEDQDVPLGTWPDTPEQPRTPGTPVGANAYKSLYFDNDFSYLDDPATPPRNLIEELKRIRITPLTTLEFGGDYRVRLHDEHNGRLNGLDDNLVLQRTRFYTHFRRQDTLRVYVEMLDATSSWENLHPRPFDENQLDMVNGFVDLRLWDDLDDAELWGRVGRQEIIFGSQRLVSDRSWRNVPVFHEGARLMWRADKVAIDGFWLRPLDKAIHKTDRPNFDNVDQSQDFSGALATYEMSDLATLDLYYLRLTDRDPVALGHNGQFGGFEYNTFGSRWVGDLGPVLGEFEGGYQFGNHADDRQSAGFYTIGIGQEWTEATWSPSFWVYYDWASGNENPYSSTHGTFYQMFPRGHYYLGWADIIGRMNIRDFNMRLTAKPDKKIALALWYHMFQLDQARDALYNPSSVPVRWDPSGAAGRDVGNELDFSVTYITNRQAETLIGYSYLFAGDFLKRTGNGKNVGFFYLQQILRF